MAQTRNLPIGIQSFEDIRTTGYLYIDKTDSIYNMTRLTVPYFISRPRRFGKSLLISTLENYFLGRKDLFAGLAIEKQETKWEKHPVFKIALNGEKYVDRPEALDDILSYFISHWEQEFGKEEAENSISRRFSGVISRAYEKTGKKVVVLIDEYDKPILDTMQDKDLSEANRNTLRGFYGVLKSSADYLRFVLITGITKIANLNVFSELNQLVDISMEDEYASICGITQEEMETQFVPEIEELAKNRKLTYEETLQKLKENYDGYRFSEASPDIYNPFSLLSAFRSKDFGNYWFHTGTPAFLVKMIEKANMEITHLEGDILYSKADLMNYRIDTTDPVPLLYQTGYLTIKEFVNDIDSVMLGYPNNEVKISFIRALLPMYAGSIADNVTFMPQTFLGDLYKGNIDEFMLRMQTYYSRVPFDLDTKSEKHYKLIFYLLINAMGKNVMMEDHSAAGSCDAVLKVRNIIYIIEFKLAGNGTIEDAFEQIEKKNYAGKYALDGKKIVKIAAEFDGETRTIGRWETR